MIEISERLYQTIILISSLLIIFFGCGLLSFGVYILYKFRSEYKKDAFRFIIIGSFVVLIGFVIGGF